MRTTQQKKEQQVMGMRIESSHVFQHRKVFFRCNAESAQIGGDKAIRTSQTYAVILALCRT